MYKVDNGVPQAALSQSKEISSDLCCFYGGGVSHNEDIMHALFLKVYCCLIPNHPPPIETRMEISCKDR